MRSRILGLGVALCLAFPAVSKADTDVQEMLQACEALHSEGDAFSSGECAGEIRAVSKFLTVICGFERKGHDIPVLAADINDVSVGALSQVFISWAKANPTKWGKSSTVGISMALSEAYPCD